jgi:hypothetical protein
MSSEDYVPHYRRTFRGVQSAYRGRIVICGVVLPLISAVLAAWEPEILTLFDFQILLGARPAVAALCVAVAVFETRAVRRGHPRDRVWAAVVLGAACAPCLYFGSFIWAFAALSVWTLVGPFLLGAPLFALCAAYSRIRRLARCALRPRAGVLAAGFVGLLLGSVPTLAYDVDVLRFRRLMFDAAAGDADAVAALRTPRRRAQVERAVEGKPPKSLFSTGRTLPEFRVKQIRDALDGVPLPGPAPALKAADAGTLDAEPALLVVGASALLFALLDLLIGSRRRHVPVRRST